MPEVYPIHVPAPRCVLGWDGTAYRALTVDANGHIQADVLTSALPAGAATAAHQLTMITALQLIDDLRNALQSVATDRVKVRGENQLFSFKGVLVDYVWDIISGVDGYRESNVVPAGEVWVVTTICGSEVVRPTTAMLFGVNHDGGFYMAGIETRAIGTDEHVCWSGHMYLDAADYVRVYFIGGQAGDGTRVYVTGYRMTAEA